MSSQRVRRRSGRGGRSVARHGRVWQVWSAWSAWSALGVPWARRLGSRALPAAAVALLACVGAAAQPPQPPPHPAPPQPPAKALQLRVIGGLAGMNQYLRHEAPFWTTALPRLSGGRYTAEIVPFDRAGIRGQDLLTLLRLGTATFGTVLLSQASLADQELAAPDLAGINPDAATLRRTVAAMRPQLQQLLRTRHGVEMLALYTYPAQVLYCRAPLAGLDSLRGRSVRTSSTTQADWVRSLGAKPVATTFAEMLPQLSSGQLDCAITGTMSGNTIGLHEHTSHLHTMAVGWGLSVFVVHRPSWLALPPALQALLLQELPRLEAAIWEESLRETEEGIRCNGGLPPCSSGRPGRMAVHRPSAADEATRLNIITREVLPRWLDRCGPPCAETWARTLAPVAGLAAPAR